MSLDLGRTNLSEMAEAGYEFELKLPEVNTPTGAFVTVRGAMSPVVKAFARKKFTEMQNREQMAKKRGRTPDEMGIEDLEAMAVESAVTRIISWKGISENGVEIPFTKEVAEKILNKHSWIREQILAESDMLGNFIKQ